MRKYIFLFLAIPLPLFAQDGGKHLSLEESVQRARSASHRREEAEADLDAQSARRRLRYTSMGPDARVEYRDIAYDQNVAIDFGGAESVLRPDRLREGSLVITQPLLGLYRNYQAGAAESSHEESLKYALEGVEVDAAFSAAELYRRGQQANEWAKIAESSLAAADSQEKDAESLLRSGKLLRGDLLKIQMAQQDAKAQLARAQAGKKKAMERLRYLLVLEGAEPIELDPLPHASDLDAFQSPELTKALERAKTDRSEYRQAESDRERSAHALKTTQAQFLPNVDFFLRWDTIYSETLPFGTPRNTRSFGISASWDLWDNGARLFAMQEASAQQHKADAHLRETSERFRVEIESLLADAEAARQNLDSAKIRVAQAEEAYRIDKARFTSGYVTTTDLLLSEANLTRARGAWVEALVEADVLVLNLKKAMGAKNPV